MATNQNEQLKTHIEIDPGPPSAHKRDACYRVGCGRHSPCWVGHFRHRFLEAVIPRMGGGD